MGNQSPYVKAKITSYQDTEMLKQFVHSPSFQTFKESHSDCKIKIKKNAILIKPQFDESDLDAFRQLQTEIKAALDDYQEHYSIFMVPINYTVKTMIYKEDDVYEWFGRHPEIEASLPPASVELPEHIFDPGISQIQEQMTPFRSFLYGKAYLHIEKRDEYMELKSKLFTCEDHLEFPSGGYKKSKPYLLVERILDEHENETVKIKAYELEDVVEYPPVQEKPIYQYEDILQEIYSNQNRNTTENRSLLDVSQEKDEITPLDEFVKGKCSIQVRDAFHLIKLIKYLNLCEPNISYIPDIPYNPHSRYFSIDVGNENTLIADEIPIHAADRGFLYDSQVMSEINSRIESKENSELKLEKFLSGHAAIYVLNDQEFEELFSFLNVYESQVDLLEMRNNLTEQYLYIDRDDEENQTLKCCDSYEDISRITEIENIYAYSELTYEIEERKNMDEQYQDYSDWDEITSRN